MATYNTLIKKRNASNTGWDSILPITTAENVLINEQGDTVATHLADIVTDSDGVHGLKIESGTWTPVIAGVTTSGVFQYSNQLGKYMKIGKLVKVTFATNVSTVTTPGSGALKISGLPFKVANNTVERGAGSVSMYSKITLSSGYTQISLRCHQNASELYVHENGSDKDVRLVDANKVIIGTAIYGSAVYEID